MSTIKSLFLMIFDPVFLTNIRLKMALEAAIKPLATKGVRCLDIGCGNRPYEYLFQAGHYVGVDVESSGRPFDMKQPDYFYDGVTLPLQDNSFDMVMSTQVLEHVPDPSAFITEMARVCKRGGAAIVSLPFVYQQHEEPYDYFRFTQFGIEELLKNAGLKIETIKKDSSALEAIAILINVYVIHNLVPNIRGFSRLYALFICFPLQVIAIVLSKILPDGGQLYLNLVVCAKKV
jgi:SAM-dependent methyltransferase